MNGRVLFPLPWKLAIPVERITKFVSRNAQLLRFDPSNQTKLRHSTPTTHPLASLKSHGVVWRHELLKHITCANHVICYRLGGQPEGHRFQHGNLVERRLNLLGWRLMSGVFDCPSRKNTLFHRYLALIIRQARHDYRDGYRDVHWYL